MEEVILLTKEQNMMKYRLEELGWRVYLNEQDGQVVAEIEKWTSAGVDMIITLFPFCFESLSVYVDDFDVDDEIESHRQDERYKMAFTIRQSLEDFEDFEKMLQSDYENIEKFLNEDDPKPETNEFALTDEQKTVAMQFKEIVRYMEQLDIKAVLDTSKGRIYLLDGRELSFVSSSEFSANEKYEYSPYCKVNMESAECVTTEMFDDVICSYDNLYATNKQE